MTILDDIIQKASAGEEDSLTSSQGFAILDKILENALRPIEETTPAFYEWVAELMSDALNSRRRNTDKMLEVYASVLAGGHPNASKAILSVGVDRGHVFKFLERIIVLAMRLQDSQREYHRSNGKRVSSEVLDNIANIQHEIGRNPYVVPAAVTSRYWLHLADAYKKKILDYFIRMLAKNAIRNSTVSGGRIQATDSFSINYTAASIAANQFQAQSGAFGPYLARFLLAAGREAASHSVGLVSAGRRIPADKALVASPLEDALDVFDNNVAHTEDGLLLSKIHAVARDPEIRAVLMISGIVPPAVHATSKTNVKET